MIALALLAAGVATGRFDVTVKPTASPDPAIAALVMTKSFHGGLDGTGVGEMLASGGPGREHGSYVALERVTGTLDGRRGAFTFQHRGAMTGTRIDLLEVTVVPGSGTGALAGLAGTMTIDVAHGHAYAVRYTLPGR